MSTKIDLDELEHRARTTPAGSCQQYGGHVPFGAPSCAVETLALIARIRDLEALIDEIPDHCLQEDKVYRDELPRLFTDKDGAALYMDEAKRRLLALGAVLP